jgi:hypothetical protein
MARWHAAILGPEGSPYWGGVFVLDINFQPTYPHTPPEVGARARGGTGAGEWGPPTHAQNHARLLRYHSLHVNMLPKWPRQTHAHTRGSVIAR